MASVYEIVTEQVVKALESGVCPWRKPWSGGHRAPMNIVGREYRGINVFLLFDVCGRRAARPQGGGRYS
jgi:antirestriction protein ArdC